MARRRIDTFDISYIHNNAWSCPLAPPVLLSPLTVMPPQSSDSTPHAHPFIPLAQPAGFSPELLSMDVIQSVYNLLQQHHLPSGLLTTPTTLSPVRYPLATPSSDQDGGEGLVGMLKEGEGDPPAEPPQRARGGGKEGEGDPSGCC